MMRVARSLIILLFAASVAAYGGYVVKYMGIEDTKPPVIRFDKESFKVEVDASEEDLLKGVTAEDETDGDVTDSLMVVSISKFKEKGKCSIEYAAFDQKGNAGTATRELVYKNYKSPKFELTKPLRYETSASSYPLLDRISASDCIDGDISNVIKYAFTGERINFYGETGTMDVTFQVTNSSGDTVTFPAGMEIMDSNDYAKPCPKLSKYLVYTKKKKKIDLRELIEGVSTGSSEYLFEDHKGEDEPKYRADDIKVDDSELKYSKSGVYKVYYTLTTVDRQTWERENQGTVTLYVIVQK